MNDQELERILKRGFAAMAGAQGACPSTDELARYHAGELAPTRAAEIAAHAVRCPACDLSLDRMERFDHAISDDAGARGVVAAFSGRARVAVWKTALAGAIAALVLVTLPLYWFGRPKPAAHALPTATLARVLVMPQSRDSSERPQIRSAAAGSSVVVSFFVEMAEGKRYNATVEGRSGVPLFAPVDISSEVQTGNVSLNVPSVLVPPGAYTVVVSETGGAVITRMGFEVAR